MADLRELDRELRLFEALKAQWLDSYENEFVVIKGSQVLGFFTEFSDAYCAGAQKYGLDTDFLVRRILPKEPVSAIF